MKIRFYQLILMIAVLFSGINLTAQQYTLGQGGANIVTCGGTILDPGGTGQYANNVNVTQTFTSANPGECIQLTINTFATEANYDFVRIYNGAAAAGEPLLDYSGEGLALPMVLTSTVSSGGSITISFTSDGSVTRDGFSISIACIPCPADPIIYTLGQGGATINGCGGILRDPGATNNYPDNANVVQTFCSGTGDCVRLTFTEFEMESGIDFIRFYDGNSVASPLLDIVSGFAIPPAIVTSDQSGGCLTIQFTSNAGTNLEGFKATLDCVPCAPPPTVYVLGVGPTTINTCGGVIKDPGASGDYPPNQNVIQTFCSDAGNCVRLTFDQVQTQNTIDVIRFYDGATIGAALIDEVSGFNIPPAVTSTTNSGGCMTVQFISDAFTNNAGFSATISCVPCPPPPDILILGQGGPVINTCNAILQDPGGPGQYGNNLNITQTICSGTNECINLTFTEFTTEATFDRLTVYDGPDNTAELLGIFSGFNMPPPISSSTASGGCMTLVFTSNATTTNIGWEAVVSCVTCQDPIDVPTGFCDDAQPFCTEVEGGLTFPAATNTQSEFGGGICCLGSTPNPAWYFMRIEETGPIDILITSGFDVDFICWGPFTELQWENGICGEVLDGNQDCAPGAGSYFVDCSYSGAAIENCNIPNAQAGEYYMLLLTNFSNQVTNINFQQNGGEGSTDCSIFCELDVPVNPTACDPATNTFSMTGDIELTNPPETGTLTIANSLGGFVQYTAPFDPIVNYNFTNMASNGAVGEISVVFSDDNTCAYIQTYNAPESCSVCPVEASTSGPACIGQSVSLNATDIVDATYSWTGPNGFTSTDQNPVFPTVTAADQGVYTVTATVAATGCQSIATTNIFVFPTPAPPVPSSNGPVCEGTALNLSAANVAAGTFAWTGPNGFTSAVQNPSIAAASAAANGQYSLVVSVNGCPSPPALLDVVVNPYPATPEPTNNGPLCAGDLLQLNTPDVVGGTFEWTNPTGIVFSALFSPQIANTTPAMSGNYSVRVQVNGCWSLPATTAVVVHPIPAMPAITTNSPVCQGETLNISGPAPLPVVGTDYSWNGPNAFTSNIRNPEFVNAQPNLSGNYTLVITENGCSSPVGNVDVVVVPLPISNAGADLTVCSLVPAQIGTTPTAGYTYSWSPIQGLNFTNISNPISTISNVSTEPIIQEYIVTTTDLGCTTTDTVLVTSLPQPIANFEGPAPMCFEGNSFNFEAGGQFGPLATFDWQFGPTANLPNSSDRNPQAISFGSTGLNNVTLQITDQGCASNVFQFPVQVWRMPVANFDASAYTACEPALITFNNLAESDDPIKTVSWSFGNDKFSQENNPTILYSNAGSYTVSLQITSQYGCEDIYRMENMIVINPTPKAGFSVSPDLIDIINPYTEILDVSNGASEIVYQIPGLDTIYTKNARPMFPDSGSYTITQLAINEFGCIDSTSRTVYVQIGYKLYVPTAFTPNDDGYNDVFRAFGEDVAEFSMNIYNRWGELLYSTYDIENGWDGKTRLSDKTLPGGVYIYKIQAIDRNGLKNTYEGTLTLLR